MFYKAIQRSKKFKLASFSQVQKRETRKNPKILANSQMDEMAPENVTTSGTSGTRCKKRSSASAILSVEQIL